MPRRSRKKPPRVFLSEPPYLHLIQHMFETIARHDILPKESWRVLAMIFARCDWGNVLPIHQADMARELGISPANVNKAIKHLLRRRVLLRFKEPGRHAEYKLNASLAIKGHNGEERDRIRRLYSDDILLHESAIEWERPSA